MTTLGCQGSVAETACCHGEGHTLPARGPTCRAWFGLHLLCPAAQPSVSKEEPVTTMGVHCLSFPWQTKPKPTDDFLYFSLLKRWKLKYVWLGQKPIYNPSSRRPEHLNNRTTCRGTNGQNRLFQGAIMLWEGRWLSALIGVSHIAEVLKAASLERGDPVLGDSWTKKLSLSVSQVAGERTEVSEGSHVTSDSRLVNGRAGILGTRA